MKPFHFAEKAFNPQHILYIGFRRGKEAFHVHLKLATETDINCYETFDNEDTAKAHFADTLIKFEECLK